MDSRQALEQGPFYACDISVGSAAYPMGGLTSAGCGWRRAAGRARSVRQTDPGLYAAGRAAVGIPSHMYISGLSLADCVFSGRRAGRAAAAIAARAGKGRRMSHPSMPAVIAAAAPQRCVRSDECRCLHMSIEP